ncbi:MAG: TolC family protein [Pseudomonadota bacterium]
MAPGRVLFLIAVGSLCLAAPALAQEGGERPGQPYSEPTPGISQDLPASDVPVDPYVRPPADDTLTAVPVVAEADAETPLSLETILASSVRHAPAILEAFAEARAAEGRITSAEGAFDLVFNADTYSFLSGFYDGQYLETLAIQPLANNGGRIEGGYRISRGDFPIYNDFFFTNKGGELKAKAIYALLRDRNIDARRFAVGNAELEQLIEETEAVIVAIGVQQRALEAYNMWVGAGQQLLVYRNLLALAEARQTGLSRQVALGARADIILVENEQNILRRQALVTRAERDVEQAANRLSLFYRTNAGRPKLPVMSQLPPRLPQLGAEVPDTMMAIMARRPDLQLIERRLDQARLKLQLARNELRPKLDVFGEISNDFGAIGEGTESRDGFETIVGLNFSIPLQQRGARGRIDATNAELRGIDFRRQRAEEQLANTLRETRIAIDAARELARLAAEEQERAERLAAGERRLFEAGASDFFLVNLREEAAADANVRRLQADFDVLARRADLAAITADFELLGME